MWQQAGDAYVQLMGRWSRLLAPLLVDFVGIGDGERVLEVGCGTGSLTRALLDRGPSVTVTGIDASDTYLAFARKQLDAQRVALEVGDAQSLRFDDRRFDAVVSLLVLNFVPDNAKAVAEMARVTRPGGRVGAAVWDYGGGMEMLRLLWDTAVEIDPSAAERHERNMPLCREGELAALWRQSGLAEVEEQGLTAELTFASFDDYWAPFLTGVGPSGSYVSGLDEGLRGKLKSRLLDRLCSAESDRPITLSARAWAVRGRVPG